jgi:N-acetylmuramoyl-L-alanine amidase
MRRLLHLLSVILIPVTVFGAMVAADRLLGAPGRGHRYVVRLIMPQSAGEVGLPAIEGPPDASRPLIVIDAGHGGHDPGAGTGPIKEKMLTLALARALRDQLLREGGIRVALTRSDDRYLFLPERSGIARRLGADLFLSIHADSADGGDASGATIYTLSERGSSDTAQGMADRENGSDTINGVVLADQSDSTSAILVDLSQRETQARSEQFARLLLREARGRMHMREIPLQSAAFIVLKSPDVPSVLFETGYISNEEDVARLISDGGRATFAQAAAKAIRAHFARQSQP